MSYYCYLFRMACLFISKKPYESLKPDEPVFISFSVSSKSYTMQKIEFFKNRLMLVSTEKINKDIPEGRSERLCFVLDAIRSSGLFDIKDSLVPCNKCTVFCFGFENLPALCERSPLFEKVFYVGNHLTKEGGCKDYLERFLGTEFSL